MGDDPMALLGLEGALKHYYYYYLTTLCMAGTAVQLFTAASVLQHAYDIMLIAAILSLSSSLGSMPVFLLLLLLLLLLLFYPPVTIIWC